MGAQRVLYVCQMCNNITVQTCWNYMYSTEAENQTTIALTIHLLNFFLKKKISFKPIIGSLSSFSYNSIVLNYGIATYLVHCSTP